MKNYLSFGGGVNSVAMYLMLIDQGMTPGDPDNGFEAVFVDHGTDWPETYEYVDMFKSKYPLTVLKSEKTLYNYAWDYKMFPSKLMRWCTRIHKSEILDKYQKTPCFVFIGYDWGERNRAIMKSKDGREYRWPLIENEIDREGCKEVILAHGLPVPMRSGCYICPFQRVGQVRELRKKHPDLFCKLEKLEDRNNEELKRRGYKPWYSFKKPVRDVAEKDIDQIKLWKEDEYPPCECML